MSACSLMVGEGSFVPNMLPMQKIRIVLVLSLCYLIAMLMLTADIVTLRYHYICVESNGMLQIKI